MIKAKEIVELFASLRTFGSHRGWAFIAASDLLRAQHKSCSECECDCEVTNWIELEVLVDIPCRLHFHFNFQMPSSEIFAGKHTLGKFP